MELPKIGSPATRALQGIGVMSLEDAAAMSDQELLSLHGVGQKAINILRTAAEQNGLSRKGSMQKISPFLWFEKDALGAARYYQEIFGTDNVTIDEEENYTDTPGGDTQIVSLTMFGTRFRFMGAGKHHEFNDAISFEYLCTDQSEIDRVWNALIANGGEEYECGWCIDKYGVRWQVVPENMAELTSTPEGVEKMLTMRKIIISDLEELKK